VKGQKDGRMERWMGGRVDGRVGERAGGRTE